MARFSKSQLFDQFSEDPIRGNAKKCFIIFAKKWKTSLFLITFQTSRDSNTLWSPGQSPLVWTRIWPILSRICQARLWTRDLGQATSGQGSGPSHKDLGPSRLLKMNCRWKNVPKWKKSTFRSRSLSSIGAKLTKLQLFFNFTTSNVIFSVRTRIWAKDKDLATSGVQKAIFQSSTFEMPLSRARAW